jgi:hypothetical protein
MEYIIDEIKQLDNEFIQVFDFDESIVSDKFYLVYYKSINQTNYIIVNSGAQLFWGPDTTQFEIYEMVSMFNIKSIYDIFYNFCVNFVLNNLTNTNNYIAFEIRKNIYNLHGNNCYIHHCTLIEYEHYVKNSLKVKILTINNFDDIDKYYEIINNFQEQTLGTIMIFFKLF